jgi:hypothetical protein
VLKEKLQVKEIRTEQNKTEKAHDLYVLGLVLYYFDINFFGFYLK